MRNNQFAMKLAHSVFFGLAIANTAFTQNNNISSDLLGRKGRFKSVGYRAVCKGA